MDRNIKIKFALDAAEDDVSNIAKKFLESKTFTLVDLCWWWDKNIYWTQNLKKADRLLKILLEEECCIRISGTGGWVYKKTGLFVEILHQIIRIEGLLNEN